MRSFRPFLHALAVLSLVTAVFAAAASPAGAAAPVPTPTPTPGIGPIAGSKDPGNAATPTIAPTACTARFGTSWPLGPFWWAGQDASVKRGQTMVLTIDPVGYSDGLRAVIEPFSSGAEYDYWCLQRMAGPGDPTYRMRNLATGLCLDIQGPTNANGVRVHQWNCNGWIYLTSQEWIQHSKGTDRAGHHLYSFENGFATGRCLDVSGYGSANGTPLQIWTCSSGANQRFY